MNKTIVIDGSSKKPPLFVEKNTTAEDNNAYILCTVQTVEGELWEGRIIGMSTNGKYEVELIERIA
jgi:hypothetical protein